MRHASCSTCATLRTSLCAMRLYCQPYKGVPAQYICPIGPSASGQKSGNIVSTWQLFCPVAVPSQGLVSGTGQPGTCTLHYCLTNILADMAPVTPSMSHPTACNGCSLRNACISYTVSSIHGRQMPPFLKYKVTKAHLRGMHIDKRWIPCRWGLHSRAHPVSTMKQSIEGSARCSAPFSQRLCLKSPYMAHLF